MTVKIEAQSDPTIYRVRRTWWGGWKLEIKVAEDQWAPPGIMPFGDFCIVGVHEAARLLRNDARNEKTRATKAANKERKPDLFVVGMKPPDV